MQKVPQSYTFTDILTNLGLNVSEARVYEYLLHNGPQKASKLALYLNLSRVMAYKILNDLVTEGIIVKNDPEGSVAEFIAEHPSRLVTLLERRKQKLTQAELELQHHLGDMASAYNLAGGKPNVQFYEGMKGITTAIQDTLSAQQVWAYIDTEAVDTYFPKINQQIIAKRLKEKQEKLMLFPDTEYARQNAASIQRPLSQIRILPDWPATSTLQYVYNNKVSFFTMDPQRLVAVIIEDALIAGHHRALFHRHWDQADQVADETLS